MPDSARDEVYLQSAVVVVAAHADDEVIGMSAQLARFGRLCTLIHVTNGAPRNIHFAQKAGFSDNEEYAAARRQEMLNAVGLVGIQPGQCLELDLVDQEAALQIVPLSERLRTMLRQLQPKFIFTHPYEGGHPDHDACAFAVRAAVRGLELDGLVPPVLMEFTSYHLTAKGFEAFAFLPNSKNQVHTTVLTDEERARKQRMYDLYPSQADVLKKFPIGIERHREAPLYDFTKRPHDGTLYYETFPSGMTADRWLELAGMASAELAGQGIAWASRS